MTSKRLYYILLASVCLLGLSLIGGAYGADMILSDQSKSVIAARSKSAALEQQQTQLTKAKASIKKYQDVGNIARSVVPQDKDQAQTVREIVKIAADNNIKLGTITFPSSTLGAIGAGAAGSPALSQLKAAPGITGVYTLQINVQSDSTSSVAYDRVISFLAALEHNRRTALVSGVTLQPDVKDPTRVNFSLIIDEYIKP